MSGVVNTINGLIANRATPAMRRIVDFLVIYSLWQKRVDKLIAIACSA